MRTRLACTPNVLCVKHFEFAGGDPDGLLSEPYTVHDRFIDLPSRPGLGIEVDERVFESRPYTPSDYPLWKREDGTATD